MGSKQEPSSAWWQRPTASLSSTPGCFRQGAGTLPKGPPEATRIPDSPPAGKQPRQEQRGGSGSISILEVSPPPPCSGQGGARSTAWSLLESSKDWGCSAESRGHTELLLGPGKQRQKDSFKHFLLLFLFFFFTLLYCKRKSK